MGAAKENRYRKFSRRQIDETIHRPIDPLIEIARKIQKDNDVLRLENFTLRVELDKALSELERAKKAYKRRCAEVDYWKQKSNDISSLP